MKIADADRLIKHFEGVVDVKLFTVPEIITIINSFSIDINEDNQIKDYNTLTKLFGFKPGVTQKVGGDNWLSGVIEYILSLSEEHISEVHEDD